MASFVKGIGALFSGGGANAQATQQAQQQREQQAIATARSQQSASDQSGQTATQLAGMKQPRGRRLLLSGEDNGLATTLGGAT